MDRFGGVGLVRGEVAVHTFGEERCHRCHEFGEGEEGFVECLISSTLVEIACIFGAPEAAAIAADVPVGEVIDEAGEGGTGGGGVERFEASADLLNEGLQVGEQPAVDLGAIGHRDDGCIGVELVQPGVVNEEGVGVPQRDEDLAADFVGGAAGDFAGGDTIDGGVGRAIDRFKSDLFIGMAGAKAEVTRRVLLEVHPAHGVDTDLFGGFFKPDGSAIGFVHGLALLVHDEAVAQQRLEWRGAIHHGGHGEEGVEPVAELAGEAFGDEVGGVPLLPHVGVGVVAHGGEGDDPGVEPGVADVLNAGHEVAGFGIADLDAINPGLVGGVALEVVPAFATIEGAFLEFGKRADDFEVASEFINPDGQSEAPVAFLGDHPVAHVGEPFDFAFLALNAVGEPLDLFGDAHDFIAPVHVDEPFIDETEDEFIAGAPAERVDVRVLFFGNEQAFFLEAVDDELHGVGVDGVLAGEGAEAFEEVAVWAERCDRGETVGDADLMINIPAAGGAMDNACSFASDDVG